MTEKIYKFIKKYIKKHGYSPSFEDIKDGVGASSKSVVYYHMHKLKKENRIDFIKATPRTISIKE